MRYIKFQKAFNCFLLLTLSFIIAFTEEEKKTKDYLSPSELIEIVEKSDINYEIICLDDLKDISPENFADKFWPQIGARPMFPWVEVSDKDGEFQAVIEDYQFKEETLKFLEKAEEYFDEKNYRKALKIYQKAEKRDPGCYLIQSHIGDCYHFQDQHEEAVKYYEKAIELNPYDYRTYFYLAKSFLKQDKFEKAKPFFIKGLSLRPRYEWIKALKEVESILKAKIHDEDFKPLALAIKDDGKMKIYYDCSKAHWITYGLCKGIWIAEESYRKKRIGESEHPFSILEERECLLSLLEAYSSRIENNPDKEDPQMERLLRVMKSGMLNPFIMYEMGSRIYPHYTLLFPDDVRIELEQYIKMFVIQDIEDSSTADEKSADNTAAEEQQELVSWAKSIDKNTIHKMVFDIETEPLSEGTEMLVPVLLTYFEEMDYIFCLSQVLPLIRSKDEIHKIIWFQMIFASGDFVLQNPDQAKDQYAYTMAGLESALRTYEKILEKEPKAQLDSLDDLLVLRSKGRLGEHVKAHLCEEDERAFPINDK